MPNTSLIDGFKDSFWYSTASTVLATEQLQDSVNCDLVIIGAGFTCPVAGSIQPLSYTRELARAAISKGMKVYTKSSG